jgi:hypothetical protein
MEKNQVVRKKRKLRKGRVFGAIALLLSVIVFGTIQVKDGIANNEKELVVQEPESQHTITVVKVKEVESIELEETDGFVYNKEIPMPKEHQFYLYQKVQERGLDYNKTLALIATESGFKSDAVSHTNDYGYFQINEMNHERLAETLSTKNSPLDPYVNIDWGTYMLATLYDHWKEEGVTGEDLDIRVWSSYLLGLTGFSNHGVAERYVSKIQKNLEELPF